MSFKYEFDTEKDEKYWIQVLTLLSFFNAVIFFLLNCQKTKKTEEDEEEENKGLLYGHLGSSRTPFFFFVLKLSQNFVVLFVGANVGDCPFRVHTDTETQRKVLRGERPESSPTLLLSFLFTRL